MRYLVTGGAGFIGSWLVDALIEHGHTVDVVDNLSTGLLSNVNRRAVFHDLDLAITMGPDFPFDGVFHLASSVGVEKIYQNPGYAAWNIVNSAWNVCRSVKRHGSRTRLVLVSTSEVYGHCVGALREEYECRIAPGPRWAYAAAKLATETMAADAVVARIFNTIGPRQRPDYGMVVPRFIKAALNHDPLPLFSDYALRTFGSVKDTVAGLITLMDRATPGIYNIAGPATNRVSIGFLAEEIIRICKSNSTISLVNAPYKNWDDIADRQASTEKLQALGWKALHDLRETLEWTVAETKAMECVG